MTQIPDSGPGGADPPEDAVHRQVRRAEQRLRELGVQLLEHDERRAPDLTGVLEAVTAQIRREARAGRDIPMANAAESVHLVVTEGALRGLLREQVDGVPGVVVAKCGIEGDLVDAAAPVSVKIGISVAWRQRMAEAAASVRTLVTEVVETQTGRTTGWVDVEILDLHTLKRPR